MFCTTCGSMLSLKKTDYGKWMSCPNGHSQPKLVQKTEVYSEKGREVRRIEAADGVNILAVHDHVCKKCGYDKAELLEIGPSYSDEDGIYRMKCGSCGHVEQLEGKVR